MFLCIYKCSYLFEESKMIAFSIEKISFGKPYMFHLWILMSEPNIWTRLKISDAGISNLSHNFFHSSITCWLKQKKSNKISGKVISMKHWEITASKQIIFTFNEHKQEIKPNHKAIKILTWIVHNLLDFVTN